MDFGSFQLTGFSRGGIETEVTVPQWSLSIDVGRGRHTALRSEHLALTHTHMDHAGGLPYLLALRQLYGMRPPTLYVPARQADALAEMLAAWDRLQRFPSRYQLVPVVPGERYPLARDLELAPFRTRHVLPSVGYTVIRGVDKLKPEYRGLPGPDIVALKARGAPITDRHERALLSVTGDTLAELLDDQPALLDSEVLLLECTFLDERKPYAAARAGGHIHLSDLMARADRFRNQTLVLSHFSQLYRRSEIASLLRPFAARIQPELRTFPVRPGDPAGGVVTREPPAGER